MNEIELPEFRVAQAKMREAKAELETAQNALKDYEKSYQRYSIMQKVCDKEQPLAEIINEINMITVEAGRKVMVQWGKDT